MYANVVIGTPLVHPAELLAHDITDWEETEKKQTLFTNTRYLPAVMKEAGIVQSTREVKRNRPELCRNLDKLDCIELKWGKRFLYIVVGGDGHISEEPIRVRTVRDVFDEFSDYEKRLVYELVGQALETGSYSSESMIMFDDEKRAVVQAIIDQAMKGE